MRSAQLERDFFDPAALDHYIVTPAMADAFQRIEAGLTRGSGRRAWRITGDYGVGKSSFAVVLAHLLFDPQAPQAARIAAAMGMAEPVPGSCCLWPVLVTGARERIVAVIARGIVECLRQLKPPGGTPPKAWAQLIARAESLVESGDAVALEGLIQALRFYAHGHGAGILLVIDELGKLLEHAAQSAGREDVFVLQRLAEIAARSFAQPFLFVGLLHQGFQAYAERLPPAVRHEWDKVASRFDEIVFDQPLAHTAALVAGTLGVQRNRLPREVVAAARETADATALMGWLSGASSAALTLDAASLYPIHPTLLPPLVRFFARYGQHERSLFGFLLSSEPFGLQAFAERKAGAQSWYGLAEFYDYVRSVFGHRLSGAASYQTHWLRVTATVDTAQDLSSLEFRVLKTVAILNLLDSDDLLATDRAVLACLSPALPRDSEAALRTLTDRGLLFRRGIAGGYRLWPNSSVNLGTAMEAANRALGGFSTVSQHIEPFLDREPLLARRHYVQRGTMRFFEVRYAAHDQLQRAADRSTDADGVVLLALADTREDCDAAIATASQKPLASRQDLIVGVLKPLIGLTGELRDLKCWQWIAENTPELAHDPYAAGEVSRQLANARRALGRAVSITASLRDGSTPQIAWIYRGVPFPAPHGLSSALSDICDELFKLAPRVTNELINRNNLSSAAAAARMRLIEGLFRMPERPLLGIDPVRAPPEKSMYLSVIKKGGLHRPSGDGYTIALPAAADPLNLKPSLDEIQRLLETSLGARVAVTDILARLARQPYGVRAGLAPLLLAIVVQARAHELAVYENGTFRSSFGAQDFLRLIKAPATFELQHCRLEGVRAEVFARLAETFAQPTQAREPQILDVVQPLCGFAAQLPEYTRKAEALERHVAKVRDVLLSATEPSGMLFNDLPMACDLEPFSTAETADPDRANLFVTRLQSAVNDLRSAYPRLLGRIIETVRTTLAQDKAVFDRAALASRAARVTLAAKLPRLRTFAIRLRDPGASDEAWAEALASFLISKPPTRWGAEDETRCLEELATLGGLFHRVEVVAFDRGRERPSLDAVRISLTRADGEDRVQIIENATLDPRVEQDLAALRNHLPLGRDERLQFLMKLLWEELVVTSIDDEIGTPAVGGKARPQCA